MAKSRKNQGSEARVAKYKESKKQKQKTKSMELPQFKPFRQVPHWEPDSKIEISGQEFSLLQNFFNVFAEPINVMQDIFSRNLNNGTITVKYVDNDGREVEKEEVKAYMEEVRNYLATQAEQEGGVAVPTVESESEVEQLPTFDLQSEVEAEITTPSPSTRKLKVVTD